MVANAQSANNQPADKNSQAKQAEQAIPDFVLEILEKQNLSTSETPRANILIAASYVDDLLTKLLKKAFIKPASSDDKLFDGYGPMYNFGSKIELAHRCGLISEDFAWVLHRVRKLRDDCAHSHDARDFSSGPIKDIIDVTYAKMQPNDNQNIQTIDKFRHVFTGLNVHLWTKINNVKEFQKLPYELTN